MATYNNRRGPNVAEYLRTLNMQETMPVEDFSLPDEDFQKDIALFTNTEFFDYDSGQNTDYQKPPNQPDAADIIEPASATTEDGTATDTFMNDYNLDFMPGDFSASYGEFSGTYNTPTIPTFPDQLGIQSVPPSAHQGYPVPPVQPAQPGYGAQAPLVPGDKRPSDLGSRGPVMNFEEQTRRLAEEDKRRRNTAASARFRIKKKQREMALEKSAKEMTDKVTALENRIQTLETENKWLKSLVMDKHTEVFGKEELAKLLSLDKVELSKLVKKLDVAKIDKDRDADISDESSSPRAKKPKVESAPSKTS